MKTLILVVLTVAITPVLAQKLDLRFDSGVAKACDKWKIDLHGPVLAAIVNSQQVSDWRVVQQNTRPQENAHQCSQGALIAASRLTVHRLLQGVHMPLGGDEEIRGKPAVCQDTSID